MLTLEQNVTNRRNNLKTDRLDMSFGEIINLYEEKNLFISPEYQRSYRWSNRQQTDFIETLLLGIPIPPIFVAEDNEGRWELVDGLQRISTILAFFNKLENYNNNLFALDDGKLIGMQLKGITSETLPLKLKNTIKRSVCRIEILRWDSDTDMRYELFNRLNTGSSPLKQQEIRNCIFLGDFNDLLKNIAKRDDFVSLIEPDEEKNTIYINEMYLEELILRYFAITHDDNLIKSDIPDYLTSFMKKIVQKELIIDLKKEESQILQIINFLWEHLDYKIFRGKNYRFSENFFDTGMYILYNYYDKFEKNPEKFDELMSKIKDDEEYKKSAGSETHIKYRFKRKFERAKQLLDDMELS